MDDVNWTKAMFGEHAMHLPGRLVFQEMGNTKGRHVVMVVGVLTSLSPILSEKARELDCPHELIVGDFVLRPHGKFASRSFIGSGANALLTSKALIPEGHEHQTLDNGFSRLYKDPAS